MRYPSTILLRASLSLALLVPAPAPVRAAAPVPVAGRQLKIAAAGTPARTRVTLRLEPTPLLDGVDPAETGLALTVGADGGSTARITLEPSLWTNRRPGLYRYSDPSGSAGGIVSAKLLTHASGTALDVMARGANWPWQPVDPATAPLLVRVESDGVHLCAQFPSVNSRNTAAPPSCTALCGDGLPESAEGCDDGDRDDGDACTRTCRWTGRGVWISAGALDWPADFEDFLAAEGIETATYFYSSVSARDYALENQLAAGGSSRQQALETFAADPHWDLASLTAGLADRTVYPSGMWPIFFTSNPSVTGEPGQLVVSDYESDAHAWAFDVWAKPPNFTPQMESFAAAATEMATAVKSTFPSVRYSHYGIPSAPWTYSASFGSWPHYNSSVARLFWLDAATSSPVHAYLQPGHELHDETLDIVADYEREIGEDFPWPPWLEVVDFLQPTLYHSSAASGDAFATSKDEREALVFDPAANESLDPTMHLAIRTTLRGVSDLFLPATGPEADRHTAQYWSNRAHAERALRDAAGTKPVVAVIGMHDAQDPATYSLFTPIPLETFIESCVAPARDAGVHGVALWSPFMLLSERSLWSSIPVVAHAARERLTLLGMPDAPQIDDDAAWTSLIGRAASARFAASLHEPYLRAMRAAFPE